MELTRLHPRLAAALIPRRPALAAAASGPDALETALDAERRTLIHANERRLQRYMNAAAAWASAWPGLAKAIEGLPLRDAHRIVVERAVGILPFQLPDEGA